MAGLRLRRPVLRWLALLAAQVLVASGLALAAVAPNAVAGGTSRPDPNGGPGGPVLVVTGDGTYDSYLLEIMRGEGLNLFAAGDTSDLDAAGLGGYRTVVLGDTTLTTAQVNALTTWVTNGGNLVAMRPDAKLGSLLGLSAASGTVTDGYIKVDTSVAPGAGIVGETMQFHGTADRYTALSGTQVVATLYTSATASTTSPAVTVRSVGSVGGSAAAFTYDLAQSVVLTRQGNPAWAGQDRDGEDGVVRSDDLFFGGSQADYVNLDKVDIPQADEQQRLLANVITEITRDVLPLPRFWYLPRGEKAAIVMTSDNHDPAWNYGGSVGSRFDKELNASSSGCSVDDWECVRSTAYLYPDNSTLTPSKASSYQGDGFELALHTSTDCATPTQSEYADELDTQLAAFAARYPALAAPVTNRNHCIAWVDYTGVPEEEAKAGIHLDTNYYYWPGGWVDDQPGMFTGSGFPQRFSTTTGDLIDVYQATTQMTDESGQSYPETAEALLDAALDSRGYYGTFVANIHSDGSTEWMHDDIVDAAQSRDVPVISAEQLLEWTDGRNASSFESLSMSGGTLSFQIAPGTGANGLQAMLPVEGGTGELQTLTRGGTAVSHQLRTVKGVDYWAFTATAGSYTATYHVIDTTPPTVTSRNPGSGATGVLVTVKPTVSFSEAVAASSVTTSSVSLRADGASSDVPASVSTSGSTVTLTPSANLAFATRYTVTVSTAVTDLAGNPLLAPVSWSFTTVNGTLTAGTPSITGTVGVGQTLTADEGTWGPAPVSFAYQWLRGSTVVGTAKTYAVTAADVGSALKVAVTGSKTGYDPATRTSAETAIIQAGAFVPATPTIDHTSPVIGQVLTADPGVWSPVPDNFAYQWVRGASDISGATAKTYTVVGEDADSTLSVRVTGTKTNYTTAWKTSVPTVPVPKGILSPTPTPTIAGSAAVGQVLTAVPGSWGPAPVGLGYQWLRGSSEINGATSNSYLVGAADVGSTLSVRVTGTRTGYTTVAQTSTPTAVVPTPVVPPASPNPTVTGAARVGMKLTANPGGWSPKPSKFTYQWYWLKNSGTRVAIKHATKATYTPTKAVQGRRIVVRTKAYRGSHLIATRYSTATIKVQPGMTAKTPRISDTTPTVGQILTANPGTWKPATTTFTYQWYAKSTSGTVKKITGATTSTYQVDPRYAGYKLKVKVTGTAPDYKPVTKTTSYTHKVAK